MTRHPFQRLGVPVVGFDVDRALEQEGVVETVELLFDRVGRSLGLREAFRIVA